jgi:hypothetical protein
MNVEKDENSKAKFLITLVEIGDYKYAFHLNDSEYIDKKILLNSVRDSIVLSQLYKTIRYMGLNSSIIRCPVKGVN